jgi:hypothetical protein
MTVKNRASGLAMARARSQKKVYKPILETDGDFYIADIDYPSFQTFRLFNQSGENLRGVFYADSKRTYVFMHRHECIPDIMATSEHESLHAGIFQCMEWELDDLTEGKLLDKDCIRMDDNEEHNMIRIALLPEEYFGE